MDAAHQASPFQPGETIAGKYRVERVLGAGGMGVVVAATHLHLKQRVAVKLLLAGGKDSTAAQMRFMREAQTAARIKSEHVARVIDLGVLDDGLPYMAMELLEGSDLAHVIESRGPLPAVTAIDYVLQASEAIAEAHSLGMVHRDLKPANLFLTHRPDGSPLVKVLDFGISKANIVGDGTVAKSLTSSGALMGSPAYMSPEQIRDAKLVDQRCDIWALGMILYELLAGHTAFDATTVSGLLARILTDPTPPLRSARPDVPDALQGVIDMCLAKSPNDRPQTVAELARMLLPFAPPNARSSVERIANVLAKGSAPNLLLANDDTEAAQAMARVSGPNVPAHPPSSKVPFSTTDGLGLAKTQIDPRPRASSSSRGLAIVAGAIVFAGVLGSAFLVVKNRSAAHAGAATHDPGPPSSPAAFEPAPPPSTSPAPAPSPSSASSSTPAAALSTPAAASRSPAGATVSSSGSGSGSGSGKKKTNHGKTTTEGDPLGGAIDTRR